MFDAVLSFISTCWNVGCSVARQSWDYCVSGWVWLVGIIWAFLAISERVCTFVLEQVKFLVGSVASLMLGNNDFSSASNQYMDVMNTFFPVAEFFTLLTSLSLVMLTCLVYRFVKSWIPTLN